MEKIRNEELPDLYSSPGIVRVIKSRRMKWAGHLGHMGEGTGAYRILVRKPEGRRPLGRLGRRWDDNISGSGMWEGGSNGLIWPRIRTGGGHL